MTGKLSVFPGSALIGGSALIRILTFFLGSALLGGSALIRIPRVKGRKKVRSSREKL